MEEVKDIILNVYTLSVPSETTTTAGTGTTAIDNTNTTTGSSSSNSNSSSGSWSSFFVGKMLPSIGMGAYHTSLRIVMGNNDHSPYTTTYTFAANHGIIQEQRGSTGNGRRSNSSTQNTQLPPHATFKEEIRLGSCMCQRNEIIEILQVLSSHYFTTTSYHLVHRNCNHFTETFATALINYRDYQQLYLDWSNDIIVTPSSSLSSFRIGTSSNVQNQRQQPKLPSLRRLTTYPDWINRLAQTGANVISYDKNDIIPCIHPYNEAYHAVTKHTIDGISMTTCDDGNNNNSKGGTSRWNLFKSQSSSDNNMNRKNDTTNNNNNNNNKKKKSSTSNEKKELTDAQKKLLEKIRKK